MFPESPRVSRRQLLTAGGAAALGAWYVRPSLFTSEQSLDPSVPPDAWPMRGRDPSRSGYAPTTSAPTDDVRVAWRTTAGDPHLFQSPTVAGDILYALTRHELVALDAATGTERWRFATGGELPQGGPVVVDGQACYRAGVNLYAVSENQARWKFATNSSFDEVLPVGNTIFLASYFGSSDSLIALDASNGIPRWKTPSEYRPLAYADGILVGAGNPGTTLVGLDATNGETRWQLSRSGLPGDIAPAFGNGPVISNGTFYGGAGRLYAVNVRQGTVEWTTDATGAAMATNGKTIFRAGEGHVVAVDSTDGSTRWEKSVGRIGENRTSFISGLAVTDTAVYVGAESGLVALGAASGERLFTFEPEAGTGSVGPPAVVGERVYVGIENAVVALEEA
ncbi:PQQ-binding-like beta-propeller repeat protein [Haladaptatus sp. W1]|uniref:outer membrane protein assembly factor BamB family protein n=1 Tax=Haladaptatus sp. W1 TaxID=1897478 RepID=UPI000AD2F221|nr:PQQ-binding-like beta-propeller repeat protein [Haladaptatus sp. W1]